MRRTIAILVLGLAALTVLAQNRTEWVNSDIVKPRIRVIIDNDFGGDPDGRQIRVYTKIDTRLMLEDLVAKLNLCK